MLSDKCVGEAVSWGRDLMKLFSKEYSNTPIEVKLYTLQCYIQSHTNNFWGTRIYVFKFDYLKDLFVELDIEYAKEENYWRMKIEICNLYKNQQREERKAIFNLLCLNPMLEKEFLQTYVSLAHITKHAYVQIKNELDQLFNFFPNNYDLCRIKLLLKKSNVSIDDVCASLPKYQQKVFRMQVAIDKGSSLKNIVKNLPTVDECGFDREADERLLVFLCIKDIYANIKDDFENYFRKIIRNSNHALILEGILTRKLKHMHLLIRPFFNAWINTYPKDWKPYYRLALYLHLHSYEESALEYLVKAQS